MMNQEILNEFVCNEKLQYKNVLQKLILEHCTDETGEYILLLLIKIKRPAKNNGWGSAVMQDIIKLSDHHNVQVKVWVSSIYGSEINRLHGFYEKFGFISITDGDMIYNPKK